MTKTNLSVYGSFFAIMDQSRLDGPIKIENVAWV